jgi:hypothetical protein
VQTDGLWRCHQCGHANHLVHYDGPHPFKKLKCGRCYHILCDVCPTSGLLTRVPVRSTETFESRSRESEQLAYCSVYQHCGLSHRAKISGGHIDSSFTCQCGQQSEGHKLQCYIGSSAEYRRDPAARAVALSIERFKDMDKLLEKYAEMERKSGAQTKNLRRPVGLLTPGVDFPTNESARPLFPS